MNKLILVFFFITLNITAQNAKNEGWYIKEKHYPEIVMPKTYSFYQIKVNTNTDNVSLIQNKEQKATAFKNPNITSAVYDIINLTGFSKSENSDFLLEFTDLGVKHIMSVKEKKAYGQNSQNTYTGIIELESAIRFEVKDKEGKVLYDKVYAQKQESESIGVYNNAAIKSNEIALAQIKKQYEANVVEYRTDKNINIAVDVVRDISKSLKTLFSSYYENKRINLFLINNEHKFGIENNAQVEKLVALEAKQAVDYEKLANESLTLFENELKKITNKTDKKQKKIYWALLSNISGVHYALGNFEKAIEYAELRKTIDYNKKYNYNLEISQERKEIVAKNKDFDFAHATKIKVPEIISINRIGNYKTHPINSLLKINTINKLTENELDSESGLFFKTQVFSRLIGLKIPNHYKKSNPKSADQLKEYLALIKKLRSEKTPELAMKLFFEKYPFPTIHEAIKPPNVNFVIETFNLSNYETTVFNAVLEKYYMTIQAYAYGDNVILKDYDKKNTQLKEDINKLISSRNFTQPVETEILLALEYLNTQSDTHKIPSEQFGNILFNFEIYCSLFSL